MLGVSTIDNQEYNRQISDLTKVINNKGYNENQIEILLKSYLDMIKKDLS